MVISAIHLHPAALVTIAMVQRGWTRDDLATAMTVDEGPHGWGINRLSLDLLLDLAEGSWSERRERCVLGGMAPRLDRAFGVPAGHFQEAEDAWWAERKATS